jgi:hypothetical protein
LRARHHHLAGDRLAEGEIQRALFQHLAARSAAHTFDFHVPNGGWRSPIEAAILKGQGVRPGVPDLIVTRTTSPSRSNSRPRAADCRLRRSDRGDEGGRADVAVAHGLNAALRWLMERGILKGRVG